MSEQMTLPWQDAKAAYRQGYLRGYQEATELLQHLAASIAVKYERLEDPAHYRAADEICAIIAQHHTICVTCVERGRVEAMALTEAANKARGAAK